MSARWLGDLADCCFGALRKDPKIEGLRSRQNRGCEVTGKVCEFLAVQRVVAKLHQDLCAYDLWISSPSCVFR